MSNIRDAVREYRDVFKIPQLVRLRDKHNLKGLTPKERDKVTKVPVSKTGWQTENPAPEEFQPNEGVGVVLGETLAEIDLDHDCARALAAELLPKPAAIWGRTGSPRSHYGYRVSGLKMSASHGVELRTGKHQTVLPPTEYPPKLGGGRYKWDDKREFPEVDAELLTRRVNLLRCIVILYKDYPGPSTRHQWWLSAVGVVARRCTDAMVAKVALIGLLDYAVKSGIEPDRGDRLKTIEGGFGLDKNKVVVLPDRLGPDDGIGEQALADIKKLVRKRKQGITQEQRNALAKFQETHAVVFSDTDVLFTESVPPPKPIRLLKRSQFEPRLMNATELRADTFLKDKGTKVYARHGFFPPPLTVDEDTTVNRYQGWLNKPEPHDNMEPVFNLIWHMAGCDEGQFNWLQNWMSWIIKYPGRQTGAAVVLHSEQTGTGKGTFASLMRAIMGRPYATVLRGDDLVGRFTAHLEGVILAVCDEVDVTSKRAAKNLLHLITDNTHVIEPKGLTPYEVDNRLNFLFLTNEEHPVPISVFDRRYYISNVSPDLKTDSGLWRQLYDGGELNDAMVSGLHHYLLNELEPEWEYVKSPPDTVDKDEQKIASIADDEQWLLDYLLNPDVPEMVTNDSTAQDYIQQLHPDEPNDRRMAMKVSRTLRKVYKQSELSRDIRAAGDKRQRRQLGPLEQRRARLIKRFGQGVVDAYEREEQGGDMPEHVKADL